MPPSWRSGGANWHKCVTLWIRGAKKEHSGPPEAKKSVLDIKKHRKSYMEAAQNRPALNTGAQDYPKQQKHNRTS